MWDRFDRVYEKLLAWLLAAIDFSDIVAFWVL